VSASTQNQALAALLFCTAASSKTRCHGSMTWCARNAARTCARRDVARRGGSSDSPMLRGMPQLWPCILYGAGLRLLECARLRVKDVDFARSQLMIRAAKGDRDRVSVLPAVARDLSAGTWSAWHGSIAATSRPPRLGGAAVSRSPASIPAPVATGSWQWVFPATRTYRPSRDRRDPPSSPPRVRPTARRRDAPCAPASRSAYVPHLPPLVRHPSARRRLRHPDGCRLSSAIATSERR
jgi:integrase